MALQVWFPLNGNLKNKGLDVDASLVPLGDISTHVSGKTGSCYVFDGVDDYFLLSGFNMSNMSQLSIALWVKPTTDTLTMVFLARHVTGQTSTFEVNIHNNNFRFRDTGNSSIREVPFNTTFTANVWVHIAAVYDNGSVFLYKNGELTNSYIAPSQRRLRQINEPRFGRIQSTTSDSYFSGYMNDIRMFDHALSTKEVKEISKALILHYPFDSLSLPQYHQVEYVTFNGAQSITLPQLTATTSVRIEMGVCPDTLEHSQPTFFGVTNKAIQVWRGSTTQLSFWSSGGPNFHIGAFVQNEINDLVLTFNQTGMTYQLNNSSAGTKSSTVLFPMITGGTLTLGRYGQTIPHYFYGNISYVKIYCDDALAFDYVPVVQISDNAVGEYNVMAHNFYGNNGNGSLEHGSITKLASYVLDCSGYDRNGLPYFTNVTPNDRNGRYALCATNALSTSQQCICRAHCAMPPSETITVAWWANYDTIGYQNSGLFTTSQATNNPQESSSDAIHMYDGGFYVKTIEGGSKKLSVSTTNLGRGSWHHYCFTYDGTNLTYYLDSAVKAQTEFSGTLKSFTYLYISWSYAGGTNRLCVGKVSDFRMYATALSATDVRELAKTSTIIDNKANLMSYEFVESDSPPNITKTGLFEIKEFHEMTTVQPCSIYSGKVETNQIIEI